MKRREFITLLGSRRARSRASGCGGSVCSFRIAKTTRRDRTASPRFGKASTSWVGSTVGMSKLLSVGPRALPPDAVLRGGVRPNSARRGPRRKYPGFAGLAMQSVPIVFVGVSDPEGVGFVASLARPGSNTTGFANFEAEMGGKWLQSDVTRIAVFRNPAAVAGFLRTIQAVSPAIGVEPVVGGVRDAAEIVRGPCERRTDCPAGSNPYRSPRTDHRVGCKTPPPGHLSISDFCH
jgi:hypothetical protein